MKRDPIARMDEIVEQLGRLYVEADSILDDYVNAVCGEEPKIPRDVLRHRVERLREHASPERTPIS
jgi:hypothetical protein